MFWVSKDPGNAGRPPKSESPVFKELRAYVEREYAGQPSELREVIFRCAYAKYSEEKKDRCERYRSAGDGSGPRDFSAIHLEFTDPKEYKRLSQDAENTVKNCIRSAGDAVVSRTATLIIAEIRKEARWSFGKYVKETAMQASGGLVIAIIFVLAALLLPPVFREASDVFSASKIQSLFQTHKGSSEASSPISPPVPIKPADAT